MQLSGSGANDPRWLEKIAQHPPTSLSTLEYWVGPLEVDFAGGEGMGYVHRPATPPRGTLRREITRLGARFRFDMHHDRHEVPRDMSLQSFWAALDIGHATLAQVLEEQHGTGTAISTKDGPVLEFGQWFYLRMLPDGSAQLSYETIRPER